MMVSEELFEVLLEQMKAVRAEFPDLFLNQAADGRFVVSGDLPFRGERVGEEVKDVYQIEIAIPDDYPKSVPLVREVGGRISRDFHTNRTSETLCLGAPVDVKMRFSQHSTLIGYIEVLVVPYLFQHSYWEQHGIMPDGELQHGAAGLLEFYKGFFDVGGDIAVLGFLRILADDDYKGHALCPCGSGKMLRKCHGPRLLEIKPHQRAEEFLVEFAAILEHVRKENTTADYRGILPKTVLRRIRRRRRW